MSQLATAITRFALIALLAGAICPVQSVCAQTVERQGFRVRVPGVISITPQYDVASITHDMSSNNQAFPDQLWTVTNRNSMGAVVTFATNQAFTNTSDSSLKRNARLVLRKSSGRRWSITQRRDTTDYQAGQEVAVVSAESNRAGAAEFDLRVIFRGGSIETLPEGEYELTITGTIVPK